MLQEHVISEVTLASSTGTIREGFLDVVHTYKREGKGDKDFWKRN